ncbi:MULTISPECIES: PglL family O-oligosaccharyltransferase [unclassified Acinetobacter]|uniref:PglL family O-oligosaccharyltransferase n=1 Tax=unclassified Acinetobacter TaxID=196816 RepID=UPI0015D2D3B1|nr:MULTISPECIES: O-antigen ligase family protein [unclassified Acinetobacter]
MKILNIFIIILINLAVLNVEHFYPWTTFDGEKNIFYLSIVFYVYFIVYFKEKIKLEINSILILVLLISSLLSWGGYVFKQNYFIFNLYLLNVFVFTVVLINIFQSSRREIIFKTILTSLVFCGVISSFLAIFQWSGLFLNNLWIDSPNDSGRFSANLGQPNHLASLLLISLFSLFYFKIKFSLNDFLVIFLTTLIVLSLVLTQSRSVWTFFILISFFVLLKWKILDRILKLYVAFTMLTYVAIMLIFRNINSSVEIISRVNSGFGRLAIWKDFYGIIDYLKFWGSGWRNIESFQWVYPSTTKEYIFSYHNIILDLVVIFGIIGGLVSVYILICVVLFLIKIKDGSNFIIFSILIVLINHSLLEFPLFYSYFIFVFVFVFLYLCTVLRIGLKSLEVNRNHFLILFFLINILTLMYVREYEDGRSNYRAISRGYCVEMNRKIFLFDEFNEAAFLNCVENISVENLSRFEVFLLNRPSPQNILKLIFVYNKLGEYEKRDQLLLKYNEKYYPKYTLEDILDRKIF